MAAPTDFLQLMGGMIVGDGDYGGFRGSAGAEKVFEKAGYTVSTPCPGTGWEQWASEQLGAWMRSDPLATQKLLTVMAGPDEFLQKGRVNVDARDEQVKRWNGFLGPFGLGIVATDIQPAKVEIVAPSYLPVSAKATTSTSNTDPPELLASLASFRKLFPDPAKCVFLMLQFGSSPPSKAMVDTIKAALKARGFTGLRADDYKFSKILWLNIATYLHGCGAGIAIFDRVESDSYNPNVALEAGYMIALGKHIGFFKERTVRGLQSDLAGHIWTAFEIHDPASIWKAVNDWLRDDLGVPTP